MGQLFQSFWWGQPLSPYEWLSLKSFVDFGHRFDLYSFAPDIAVPAEVRVRDAAELIGQAEFFVYESGFGKGSPAAFANLFRYKLLAERGGWWVDTDVVCLSGSIPDYPRFVSRQDDGFVNNAVMRFEPRHPVMLRCLELAMEKGRSVRWGDTGPLLLTEVMRDLGETQDIFTASVCYPIHHADALDVLRPSMLDGATARSSGSQFVHLWNETLSHAGVRKTYLPPRGSLLRQLVERHRIEGWVGEYDEAGLLEAVEANARLRMEIEQRTKLERELRDCVEVRDRLRSERDAMAGSRSWRLTAPLRALRKSLSSARRVARSR
jgi:hypothetical protein